MRHALILSLFALGAALTPALAASPQSTGSGGAPAPSAIAATPTPSTARRDLPRLAAPPIAVSSQCATETGRYDVSGRVNAAGGNRYSGSVQDQRTTRHVVIVQQGNHLSVTVTSGRGSAKLSLSR